MLGAILTRLADGRFHSGEALGEVIDALITENQAAQLAAMEQGV